MTGYKGKSLMRIPERLFPIQGEHVYVMVRQPEGIDPPTMRVALRRAPGQIPWGLAEIAYAEYVRRHGSSQTLERLAERGGFGWSELYELLAFKGHRHEFMVIPYDSTALKQLDIVPE
jgi:hypothetical protein